jgi:hypothetical protein
LNHRRPTPRPSCQMGRATHYYVVMRPGTTGGRRPAPLATSAEDKLTPGLTSNHRRPTPRPSCHAAQIVTFDNVQGENHRRPTPRPSCHKTTGSANLAEPVDEPPAADAPPLLPPTASAKLAEAVDEPPAADAPPLLPRPAAQPPVTTPLDGPAASGCPRDCPGRTGRREAGRAGGCRERGCGTRAAPGVGHTTRPLAGGLTPAGRCAPCPGRCPPRRCRKCPCSCNADPRGRQTSASPSSASRPRCRPGLG